MLHAKSRFPQGKRTAHGCPSQLFSAALCQRPHSFLTGLANCRTSVFYNLLSYPYKNILYALFRKSQQKVGKFFCDNAIFYVPFSFCLPFFSLSAAQLHFSALGGYSAFFRHIRQMISGKYRAQRKSPPPSGAGLSILG